MLYKANRYPKFMLIDTIKKKHNTQQIGEVQLFFKGVKYDNTVYKHVQSMFIINNYNSFFSTDIPRVEFKPSDLIFLTDL